MHNISWHYHDVSSSRMDGNYASPWSHGSSDSGGVKKKFLEKFVVPGDEVRKRRIGRTRRKRDIKVSDDGSGIRNKNDGRENISYSGAVNDMAKNNIRGHANELHAKNINQTKSDIFGINSDSDTIMVTAKDYKQQTYRFKPPENNNNKNKDIAHPNTPDKAENKDTPHPVSGLNCADHGGPTNPKIIEEMIFWSDIPSDSDYVSPMYDPNAKEEKYLTFEPDQGGWVSSFFLYQRSNEIL